MVPAQQHLGADDAVVAGIHLWLEVQRQLAAGQGQAQVVFHAQALAGSLLHGGMEQLGGVAPGVLGPVQGDIGTLEQVGRCGAVVGDQRHADAGRYLQALAIQ
ncbi:hypothetical protein D3C79_522770 [compost metagenome]